MTIERGWRARQEAALKRAARHEDMFEMNRARAAVIGSQFTLETIVPIPGVTVETPVAPIEDDQFDPATDIAPSPATTPKARKK